MDTIAPMHGTHAILASSLCLLCPIHLFGSVQDAVDDVSTVEVDGRRYIVRDQGIGPLDTAVVFQPLLPEHGLDGWSVVGGDAAIDREGDEIHGHGNARRNTFLLSDRSYGDFILEGEIRINDGGNSGWQIRSRLANDEDPRSGVRGYQIEVDSSSRGWSGGFYDELRRGWIHSFKDDPRARSAFRSGEWNHYRIECLGPHVRTWVNGTPCADVIDFADDEGSIAFQVHSGRCDVRWRNLRIKEIGPGEASEDMTWSPVLTDCETIMFRSDIPDGDFTRSTRLSMTGPTGIRITDGKGMVISEIGIDSERKPVVVSTSGRQSPFPVTGPVAGVESNTEEWTDIVIDLEGHRMVVLIDGRTLVRTILEKDMRPAAVILITEEEGDTIRFNDPGD